MTAHKPPTHAGTTFVVEPLTAREVHDLIAAASTRSSTGIRARAIIGVLYGAGLRINEALTLHPRDVDTTRGIIRVHTGKGGRTRTVGLDVHGAALTDRWLDQRRRLGITARHPIFCAYSGAAAGKPLDPRQVRATLTRLAKRAGIEKRVHPHGLRHSLAFDLAQRGVPTHVIQAQLGHASLATTDIYVRHLLPSDVIAAMRDRDW